MTASTAARFKTAAISAGAAALACLIMPTGAQAQYRDADAYEVNAYEVDAYESAANEIDEIGANAENIRKLDIMLMVTSLRCRTGASDFQADYQAFASAHLATLNRVSTVLKAELAYLYGEVGAVREMDRSDVSMANEYGEGHPWLGCHELGSIVRQLAADRDPIRLSYAADELLATYPVYAPVRHPRQVSRR